MPNKLSTEMPTKKTVGKSTQNQWANQEMPTEKSVGISAQNQWQKREMPTDFRPPGQSGFDMKWTSGIARKAAIRC
jgi:hypothetical protein